ncbi:MAG: hypothetical protein ABJO09_15795 [Hyphomicrobiales bacterium]
MKRYYIPAVLFLTATPVVAQTEINAENCSVIAQGNNNRTTIICGDVTYKTGYTEEQFEARLRARTRELSEETRRLQEEKRDLNISLQTLIKTGAANAQAIADQAWAAAEKEKELKLAEGGLARAQSDLSDLKTSYHQAILEQQRLRGELEAFRSAGLGIEDQRFVKAEEALETRQLDPLSHAELVKIAPDRSEEEVSRADGRPLMVLLGSDPERTIKARARDLMAVASAVGKRYLAFAALAAPVDNKTLRASLQSVPGLSERVVLHQGHDRKEVKEFVPALSPEPLADTFLSLWLEDASQSEFEELVSAACDINPDAVEARLFSLGRNALRSTDVEVVRKCLHSIFYTRYPERLQAHRDRAKKVAEKAADDSAWSGNEAKLEFELVGLYQLASSLPKEQDIQLWLAQGVAKVLYLSARSVDFSSLEVWGSRLVELAGRSEWSGNADIQLHMAQGAYNAIRISSNNDGIVSSKIWRNRLKMVAEKFPFSPRIQEVVAMSGISNSKALPDKS